jgi:hypothetical protein
MGLSHWPVDASRQLGSAKSQGVAVDAAGNVYIADYSDNTVKVWSAANHKVTTLSTTLAMPTGVAIDSAGNLYASSGPLGGPFAISEWNAITQQFTTVASNGISALRAVAVDPKGTLYGVDTANYLLYQFTRAFIGPQTLSEAGTAGTDQLLPVVPSGSPLAAASDQSWLTIGALTNDVLGFSFTAHSSASSRVAHITTLGLSITATQAAEPLPTASPSAPSVAFGTVTQGTTSAPQSVTLTNTGTGPLNVGLMGISGAGFAIYSDTCSNTQVAANGGQCSVAVTFTPSGTGAVDGTLTFNDYSSTGTTQSVGLTRHGVHAGHDYGYQYRR